MKYKFIKYLCVCIATVAASGCNTEENFKARATALAGSKSLKAKVNEVCANDSVWTMQTRAAFATLVPEKDAYRPQVLCERFYNGMASGRITQRDLNTIANEDPSPALIRVLQGK